MYKKKQKQYNSNLQWIMQLEGIKSEFIAKRVNRSSTYIRQISRCETSPSEETLRAIAKVLNRSYEEVFGKVRPLPQIMIAVPEQTSNQSQAM